MDSAWFKEERALPKQEQAKAKEETKKVLLNSRTFSDRLDRILDELIEQCHRDDENWEKENWRLEAVANISRRKTLREIKTLIKLK